MDGGDEKFGRGLRVLAWIHVVLGGLGLALGGVFLAMMVGGPSGETILPWYGPLFATMAALWLIPAVWGGLAVLQNRRWAPFAIGAGSVAMLFVPPVGTVLGGIGLFLLFRDRGARLAIGQGVVRNADFSKWARGLLLVAISLAILGGIVGLGYIFRDQVEAWESPNQLVIGLVVGGAALFAWAVAMVLGRSRK